MIGPEENVPGCELRFGPAGWAYPDWDGIVYPTPKPRGFHPLPFLARCFDTVEVNSSFYRQPSAKNSEAWLRHVAPFPRFRFTAKLWEGFTHRREAWPGAEAVAEFKAGIAPLVEAGRLGAILAQFPWSFRRTPDNRQWLARVVDAFQQVPLAVELRHASWHTVETRSGFSARGIAWCNIDQPVIGDSIPPEEWVTAPLAYVRLHGRNYAAWFNEKSGRDQRYDYLYGATELAEWAARLHHMQQKARQIFVVTNNHFRGQAVVNALELQARMGAQVPQLSDSWVTAYPRLASLGQVSLRP